MGPWNADCPGATALGGTYWFHDADLGTIKGIGGILSSQGAYQGTLDRIVVDGATDTPDFEVKISGHKVPLHTEFHAIVDGTDGDTYLQPVKARLSAFFLVARGYVVRVQGEPGVMFTSTLPWIRRGSKICYAWPCVPIPPWWTAR